MTEDWEKIARQQADTLLRQQATITTLEKKIELIEEWSRKWHWSLNTHCPSAQFALDEIIDNSWFTTNSEEVGE